MVRRRKREYEEEDEKKEINIKDLINSAANQGLEDFIGAHPKFMKSRNFLIKHFDHKRLEKREKEIYKEIRGKGWSNEEKLEDIQNKIREYVASGDAFDLLGRGVSMNKGLEEKVEEGWWKKLTRNVSGMSRSERIFQDNLQTFEDLLYLAETGELNRMPEVLKSVITGSGAGSAYNALNIMKYNEVLSDRDYHHFTRIAKKMVGEEMDKTITGVKKYVTPKVGQEALKETEYKMAAAFILGITGFLIVLLPGTNITGNVIGNLLNNTVSGVVGVLLLIASLILYIKSSKK